MANNIVLPLSFSLLASSSPVSHFFDTAGEVDHFDGGFGGFGTFVAEGASGAIECVLLVVDGEFTENHGRVAVGVQLCYTLGHTLAHIIEMWGAATDYTAEHYHGIVKACFYEL